MDNTNSIRKSTTYFMVFTALFAALTAIFSQILLPIGPVPINLAMLSVFVAGGILKIGQSMLSQFVYVLLGAIGVPVFAGFRGGFACLAGPTGGYIIGYVLAAGVISLICTLWNRKVVSLAVAMIVGLLVSYTFGTAWFIISTNTGFIAALSTCVVPFLPGDAAKIVAAVLLCSRLKNLV